MTRRPAAWLGSLLGIGVLLGGVLSGAVSVEAMLIAAWLENLSAGAATVVALLRMPGGRLRLSPSTQVQGIPVRTEPDGTRSIPSGCAAGFFAAHFGIFTVVHGTFLGVAVATAAFGSGGGEGIGLSGTALLVVVAAAVLRALRPVEPRRAIAQAYAGLVPLHVAVLALFATTVDLDRPGAPQRGPALLIVGLLVVGDLIRAWIGARAGAPPSPPATSLGPPPSSSTPPPPPPPPAAPNWPPPTGPARG